MSARKKHAPRQTDGPPNPAAAPVSANGNGKPSLRQKCLLALAIVAETSWIAALLAMSLAD